MDPSHVKHYPSPIKLRPTPSEHYPKVNNDLLPNAYSPLPPRHDPSPIIKPINHFLQVQCQRHPAPIGLRRNTRSSTLSSFASLSSLSIDREEQNQSQKSDWEISRDYWNRMKQIPNTGLFKSEVDLLRWRHEMFKLLKEREEEYVNKEMDKLQL